MQLENGGLQMLCLQLHVTCTQGRHRRSGRLVEGPTTFLAEYALHRVPFAGFGSLYSVLTIY